MDSTKILNIVNEIRSSNRPDKHAYFKGKYLNFWDKYPKLFEAAVDPNFPLTYLHMMLDQRDRLNNSQLSVEEADKEIYDKLREDYVTPVIESMEKEKQQE